MKTTLSIYGVCLLFFVSGCKEQQDNSRPRGPYIVSVRFVDELGNNLLDKVRLKELNGNYWLDESKYNLQCFRNGEDFDLVRYSQIRAYPKSGMITLPGSSPIGLLGVDSLFIYELKFTCLELFGADTEHIILIEKQQQNQGYPNNFVRLLFDGKVIATDMDGDGSDNDRLPIVIVVPRK